MFKNSCNEILTSLNSIEPIQDENDKWIKLVSERLELSYKTYSHDLDKSLESLKSKKEPRVVRKLNTL